MKVPVLLFFALYAITLLSDSVQANDNELTYYDFPPFTMQLLLSDEQDVDPKVFRKPLVDATGSHLSNFFRLVVKSDLGNSIKEGHNSFKDLFLNASLQAKTDNEGRTVIEAKFVGQASFANSDSTTQHLTQDTINSMVAAAFVGDQYWQLLALFYDDQPLQQIDDVQVWVDHVEPSEHLQAPNPKQSQPSFPSNGKQGMGVASIAILTLVIAMVLGATLALYAYFQLRRKDLEDNYIYDNDDTLSKGESSNTSESNSSDEGDDKHTTSVDMVLSKEYWMETWEQAAAQIVPRPPRPPRPSRISVPRQSSVKPSLSAIMEEDEDCHSMSSTGLMHSLSTWLSSAPCESSSDPSLGGVIEGADTDETLSTSLDSEGDNEEESSMVDVSISPPLKSPLSSQCGMIHRSERIVF